MIKIDNLTFSYATEDSAVLKRVNLEIGKGDFLLVTGPTGSGKSTLLKTLIGLAPNFTGGTLKGSIKINGEETTGLKPHELAHQVGYVNQQPEGAFATDTVEEELAYGMEQLGFSVALMRERINWVAETLGLTGLLKRPLQNLSGGQQQRVAIGAAIAAGQKILLLDEPTSALDGEGALGILELLSNLARTHGFTVLLSEHRTTRVLPFVDGVISLDADGSLARLNIGDLTESAPHPRRHDQARYRHNAASETVISARGLSQTYSGVTALHPTDLYINSGTLTAITGDNGSGKTSLLWCLLREAWSQAVPVSMVPQNAADLLYAPSISEEFAQAQESAERSALKAPALLARLVGRIDPATHPRDLSAGQQLALALALQLSQGASLVILDEPTRGLDKQAKNALVELLDSIRKQGGAIVIATHDLEFAAQVSDFEIALCEGRIVEN
jgi:energy-coupling factor transporter ATP-binding protein EcfA2